jgi:hypoxanthine-DNA glycosylase
MPGQESLRQTQYYAHPRNSFWYIMGQLFAAGPELPYKDRLNILLEQRIALWDVVHRCVRKGSLDADIKPQTIEANDFHSLFERCPELQHVFFNGQKAATLFRRMVLPDLARTPSLRYHNLPSTSPAHASMNHDQKLRLWRVLKDDGSSD